MGNLDYKRVYRRNLPHIQAPGATLFVTFRLAGSLPTNLVQRWKEENRWLAGLARRDPPRFERYRSEFERRWFAKFELLLDEGSFGPLWLKQDRVAGIVADSLHYRDARVFRLDCFSIMPNHIHVVFKPLPRQPAVEANGLTAETRKDNSEDDCLRYYSLASIMHSLKGYTALETNRLLQREGEFWTHESYDHLVRNVDEWNSIIAYVLNNPVKAGYVKHWWEWKWNYRRSE
jgi:REP element-mobilizing transposase RayT